MIVTIDTLAKGIERCENAHPIVGFVLSPEMNRLSEVLGIMNYYKLDQVDTENFPKLGLSAEVLEEVTRWVIAA